MPTKKRSQLVAVAQTPCAGADVLTRTWKRLRVLWSNVKNNNRKKILSISWIPQGMSAHVTWKINDEGVAIELEWGTSPRGSTTELTFPWQPNLFSVQDSRKVGTLGRSDAYDVRSWAVGVSMVSAVDFLSQKQWRHSVITCPRLVIKQQAHGFSGFGPDFGGRVFEKKNQRWK